MTSIEFARYMNPPEEYKFTDDEINCLMKIKKVLEKGKTAVIKRKTDGTMIVYEEVMRKV